MSSKIGRFQLPTDLIENRAAIMALIGLLISRGLITQKQFDTAKKEALKYLASPENEGKDPWDSGWFFAEEEKPFQKKRRLPFP